jgi:hypothetical protein
VRLHSGVGDAGLVYTRQHEPQRVREARSPPTQGTATRSSRSPGRSSAAPVAVQAAEWRHRLDVPKWPHSAGLQTRSKPNNNDKLHANMRQNIRNKEKLIANYKTRTHTYVIVRPQSTSRAAEFSPWENLQTKRTRNHNGSQLQKRSD